MAKYFSIALVYAIVLSVQGLAREFPDVGGVLDFSKPQNISNRLFILTNQKSGSHLLLYSIMKITQRPLRGRVPYWHFEKDPPFFLPENVMDYPLNFSKPTTYWGHEYHLLRQLNHSGNQLIFILRNYKENISSQLTLKHRLGEDFQALGELLRAEVVNEGGIFKEYIIRLRGFDEWQPACRCLVSFEDLADHPEVFVPEVMSFIGDDADYVDFIDHYEDFKCELLHKYNLKNNRTGAGTDHSFFSRKISNDILQTVDRHVREHYPHLWETYLEKYAEPESSL